MVLEFSKYDESGTRKVYMKATLIAEGSCSMFFTDDTGNKYRESYATELEGDFYAHSVFTNKDDKYVAKATPSIQGEPITDPEQSIKSGTEFKVSNNKIIFYDKSIFGRDGFVANENKGFFDHWELNGRKLENGETGCIY